MELKQFVMQALERREKGRFGAVFDACGYAPSPCTPHVHPNPPFLAPAMNRIKSTVRDLFGYLLVLQQYNFTRYDTYLDTAVTIRYTI